MQYLLFSRLALLKKPGRHGSKTFSALIKGNIYHNIATDSLFASLLIILTTHAFMKPMYPQNAANSLLTLWDQFVEHEGRAFTQLFGTYPIALGVRLKVDTQNSSDRKTTLFKFHCHLALCIIWTFLLSFGLLYTVLNIWTPHLNR